MNDLTSKIFTEARIGTPITVDERLYIANAIAELTAHRNDIPRLEKAVRAAHEMGLSSWDISVERMCIDHDIWMMEETLKIGLVQGG
ncbi:hypothetical protein [Citrobacter phage Tr1]|nr:hypothetical protein [Citrobacter phage Tr1]